MCLMNVTKNRYLYKILDGQKINEANIYKLYDINIDYKNLYMY